MKDIYMWRTKPGDAPEFLRRWKAENEIIQSFPGAAGTEISESVSEPGLFLQYAHWDSPGHQRAALQQRALDAREDSDLREIGDLVFGGSFEDGQVVLSPTWQT